MSKRFQRGTMAHAVELVPIYQWIGTPIGGSQLLLPTVCGCYNYARMPGVPLREIFIEQLACIRHVFGCLSSARRGSIRMSAAI
jgi:hypothetical protein